MSGILFAVGALTVVVGVALAGFGIPVKEFSFGNTLIQAGVTTVVGGLIVVGLGVVVAQLQRIAEALTAKSPIRSTRPLDMFDNARAGRVPFPPKPKSDLPPRETFSDEPHADEPMHAPVDDAATHSFAPSLRNPEESQVTVEDDVSLSPQHPLSRSAADLDERAANAASLDEDESELKEHREEPPLDAGWRPAARPAARQTNSTYFDAMWPSEPKEETPAPSRPADTAFKPFEPKPFEPRFDRARDIEPAAEPEPEMQPADAEPQTVAILKSGVVDGMGYTLYVDGSIEAELPQGTLRFASINELRAHLEKNS
jgi:hypothetical protein